MRGTPIGYGMALIGEHVEPLVGRVLLEEIDLLGQALGVYSSFSHRACSLIHAGS